MISRINRILRAVAGAVLEMDDTAVPYEQLALLNDFLAKHRFEFKGNALDSLLAELKKKHLVDSITVVDSNGLIVSSQGNGDAEALSATALIKHVNSELAAPESILVKDSSGWFMVFPFNEKTYVVRAQSSLSNIELKALAREIEAFTQKTAKSSSLGRPSA